MRILYFSDVHIETRTSHGRRPWTDLYPLDLGPDLRPYVGRVDLVVLAGDIGTVRPRDGVTVLEYAAQLAAFLLCPVVLVPGNHEYYHGHFDEDRATLLAAVLPNVFVLDRREAILIAEDGRRLRVLGATLWTDYKALGNQDLAIMDARNGINDHRAIKIRVDRLFAPEDALLEHQESRAWLRERLAEPHDGPTLVVTHHVPHTAGMNPVYGLNRISPAFYSDCNDLINAAIYAGVAAWICGHHHWSMRVDLGGLPLLSAQPGYPGEGNTNWTGPGVLEL